MKNTERVVIPRKNGKARILRWILKSWKKQATEEQAALTVMMDHARLHNAMQPPPRKAR